LRTNLRGLCNGSRDMLGGLGRVLGRRRFDGGAQSEEVGANGLVERSLPPPDRRTAADTDCGRESSAVEVEEVLPGTAEELRAGARPSERRRLPCVGDRFTIAPAQVVSRWFRVVPDPPVNPALNPAKTRRNRRHFSERSDAKFPG